jgi:hypothetical protein
VTDLDLVTALARVDETTTAEDALMVRGRLDAAMAQLREWKQQLDDSYVIPAVKARGSVTIGSVVWRVAPEKEVKCLDVGETVKAVCKATEGDESQLVACLSVNAFKARRVPEGAAARGVRAVVPHGGQGPAQGRLGGPAEVAGGGYQVAGAGGGRVNGDGWISVDERLPDRDVVVLALAPGPIYVTALMPSCFERNQWREAWQWQEVPRITHWQPLPPPPAKDGAK